MTPSDADTPLTAEELDALDAALSVVVLADRSIGEYITDRAEGFLAALAGVDPPLTVVPLSQPEASIDVAWAAAEKALRSHDVFELRVGVFAPGTSYWADGWHADMDAGPRGTDMRGITTDGPTPAAALMALADRLAALGKPA